MEFVGELLALAGLLVFEFVVVVMLVGALAEWWIKSRAQ
jgi:hypothetical protein